MNKDQENKKVNPIIKDDNVIDIESKLNNRNINDSKEAQDLYRVLEQDKEYILRLINERDFYKNECERLCNYLNNRYYTDNMNSNICNMINNQTIQNNQQTQYWMNILNNKDVTHKNEIDKVKDKVENDTIKNIADVVMKNNKNVISILKYAKIDKDLLKIIEEILEIKIDNKLIEGDE